MAFVFVSCDTDNERKDEEVSPKIRNIINL